MLESLCTLRGPIKQVLSDVRSKIDVDDVLQDAAIEILKRSENAARIKTMWIAKNARRKAWRDSRRDHVLLVEGTNPRQELREDPLAALVQAEETEALEAALSSLDADSLAVIKLRFYEGASLAEIGQAFGVTHASAARRISKALEALREAMDV